ncbi:MAG: hypothetical protein ACLQGV_03020 [Bryobacteraceae bacterium]
MFARRLKLTLRTEGAEAPAPKAWLDQFFLRDFTGSSAFDETLPAGDGVLEAGFGVDAQEVRDQFERWLRGRKTIPPETQLTVE